MRMQRFQILLGSTLKLARSVKREHQCKQDSQRGNCAVGRDDERTDVEEDGMHWTKDSGSECGGGDRCGE